MQEESINIPKPDNTELSVTNELIQLKTENSSIAMSNIVLVTNKPAVSRNLDGRLEVFVRGADKALWHIWQTAPNSGWSGWQSLGHTITSNPAVYINADGRLEVFARSTDNALWHIWQKVASGSWSSWASLGTP
ncbi:hypothetical protein [Photorhabdus hindustanensis]|uniref:hypothetical protein n=1 Tax=Photorhabdus hindustanensis TaxID=2918802 RepID=UPI0015E2BAD3